MLPRTTSVDRVLQVALELALDVLGLDCGGIVLVPEDTEEIAELRARRRRPRAEGQQRSERWWLSDPRPLSKDRVFDRIAIGGELVVSEELATDPPRPRARSRRQGGDWSRRSTPHGLPGPTDRRHALYARGRRLFDESDKRVLRSIASQAATAVQQARLLKVQDEDQRLQRQLQLATDVQRRMLPRFVPAQTKTSKFRYRRQSTSRALSSGDFYDFIGLTGHLGIVVGDVVGKGIAAALLMSAVRASLRAHAQGVYDLDEVISRVNVALCRDTLDNEFATLWYGVLDPIKAPADLPCPGYEPPLIVRVPEHRAPGPGRSTSWPLAGWWWESTGPAVPAPVLRHALGDVLVAYTDGVIDTVNFDRQKFGKKRLRTCILEDFIGQAQGDRPKSQNTSTGACGSSPACRARTMRPSWSSARGHSRTARFF